YAQERLGISRTQAEDRARLARDLKDRPLLRAALEDGRFGWVAASLIVRALPRFQANEEAETAWVDHAEETTIKRLRDELRIVNRDRLVQRHGEPMTPISDAKWH